jgi:hypothetical protein
MTAATPHNRVLPYLDAPKQPLPTTPGARRQALADGVFAAVAALQGLLAHSDPAVVMKAAAMILDFEKTRLRHDRPVAGTAVELPEMDPLPALEPLHTPDRPSGSVSEREKLSRLDLMMSDPDAILDADDLDFANDMSNPADTAPKVTNPRPAVIAWGKRLAQAHRNKHGDRRPVTTAEAEAFAYQEAERELARRRE